MFSRLTNLFTNNENIDTQFKYRTNLLIAVLSVGIATAILGVVYAFFSGSDPLLFTSLIALVLQIILLFFTFQGWVVISGWLVVIGLWSFSTIISVANANLMLTSISGFGLLILISGLLLGRVTSLLVGLISVTTTAAILYLGRIAAIPPTVFPTFSPEVDTVLSVGILVLIAMMMFLSSRELQRTINRVEKMENHLTERSQEFELKRKQLEQSLSESENKFQDLVETAPTGVIIVDASGIIRHVNTRVVEIFGYDRMELIGRPIEILVPEGQQTVHNVYRRDFFSDPQKRPMGFGRDLLGLHKDGNTFPIDVALSYMESKTGIFSIAYVMDISERKKAEEALQSERDLLNGIMQTSVSATLVLDPKGKIIFSNNQAEKLLRLVHNSTTKSRQFPEWQIENLNGKSLDEQIPAFDEIINAGKPIINTQRIIQFSDNSHLHISVNGAPLFDRNKNLGGIVLSVTDISELIHADEKIKGSQRFVQHIADSMPSILYIFDLKESRVSYINNEISNILGYHNHMIQEMDKEQLKELFHPDDFHLFINPDLRFEGLQEGQVHEFEYRMRHADGDWRWLQDRSMIFMHNPDGTAAQTLGVAQDITRQKVIETELRDSAERFRLLAENATDMISKLTPNSIYLYASPACRTLLGYEPDELIGKSALEFIHSEDREQVQALQLQEQENSNIFTITYRTRCKNGDYVWFETTNKTIRDPETGTPTEIVAVSRDISERMHTQETLKEAKESAEALNRTKSEFLANMSHEIRTPMNAVIGMTSLLFDTDLTLEQRDYVETIRASGDSLLAIINDILDFSKIEAGKMELEQQPFDLRDCIESALDLVAQPSAEKGIDLAYFIAEHVPTTLVGDVTRLRQILVNLLSNAVKFTEQGEVIISVNSHPQPENRHELIFSVKDTGIGIPEDRMDRLFEAFSQVDASTTRKYGGSGLGLAISKRLAEMMGGSMWVESEIDKGSTFHFNIIVEVSTSQRRIYRRGTQPLLRGKRVLIVDDNAINRLFLTRQLDTWGMSSMAAASGLEALELLQQGEHFDIAILDMQMPDMDGTTLASEINQFHGLQTLPMIVLTSLGMREEPPPNVEYAAYLHKPIKPFQLYNAVMSAIDSQPAVDDRFEEDAFDPHFSQRHPLRILLAEDNLINQKVALHLLARLGYRADVAANGLEVLEALQRQPYDAVLMDIQMPEMDGEEAAIKIRSELPHSHQPSIIAMTAHALEGDRERYIAGGMDDYISKPVRVDQLKDALSRIRPIKPRGTNSLSETKSMVRALATGSLKGNAIDAEILLELKRTLGDSNETLKMLVESYLDEAPKHLSDLRSAVEVQDRDRLHRIAHNLKGLSATFGAKKLAVICEQLERLGQTGSLIGAQEKVVQAINEFERVLEELLLIVNSNNSN